MWPIHTSDHQDLKKKQPEKTVQQKPLSYHPGSLVSQHKTPQNLGNLWNKSLTWIVSTILGIGPFPYKNSLPFGEDNSGEPLGRLEESPPGTIGRILSPNLQLRLNDQVATQLAPLKICSDRPAGSKNHKVTCYWEASDCSGSPVAHGF